MEKRVKNFFSKKHKDIISDPPVRREIIKLLKRGLTIKEITAFGYSQSDIYNMSFRMNNPERWRKDEINILNLLKQGFTAPEIIKSGCRRHQVHSAVHDYEISVAVTHYGGAQEYDFDPIPNNKIELNPQLTGDELERYKRCKAYRDLFKRPGKIDFEHWKNFVNYKGK